jgi:hypothetical protein
MPEMKMKTIANCKAAEFLRQANRIRKAAKEYYDTLDISGIRERMAKQYANQDETERKVTTYEFISEILDSALEVNAEKTVEIIGLAAFLNYDEAQELEPGQMIDILLECLASERVMSFFIKMASLGGSDTESISHALTLAKSIFSAMSSSDSTSSSAMMNESEKSNAGGMSENA